MWMRGVKKSRLVAVDVGSMAHLLSALVNQTIFFLFSRWLVLLVIWMSENYMQNMFNLWLKCRLKRAVLRQGGATANWLWMEWARQKKSVNASERDSCNVKFFIINVTSETIIALTEEITRRYTRICFSLVKSTPHLNAHTNPARLRPNRFVVLFFLEFAMEDLTKNLLFYCSFHKLLWKHRTLHPK